ncbi:hypothetical protein LCGC14_1365030 [marine sediment metagenome]|uniref:Uncharacterized protein n=1 Tax=marine sediment metagenome TaxID=412755 RepID=A0A0F9K7I2_9ZZZZ
MSLLPKKFPFMVSSITGIRNTKDMVRVFSDFVKAFTQWYDKYFDHVESGGFQTASWRVVEALDDTTYAPAVAGDLLFQRKIAGIWTTAWTVKGT